MKKKKKNKNNNKKKRAPDPPGYLRPNSFVPRAPKGTHAGEGSLAPEKVSLPIVAAEAQPLKIPFGSVSSCKGCVPFGPEPPFAARCTQIGTCNTSKLE